FAYCQALTTINIPEGVTEIAEGTFMTTAIESITLPQSVVKIGAVAFANSTTYGYLPAALKQINWDNIVEIGDAAFIYTAMDTVEIPNVEVVGANAFAYCGSTTINMPKATTIGEYAFADAKATTISVPNATTIGAYAFYQCKNLQELDLSKATTIGAHAFDQCKNLQTLNIASAENVGERFLKGTQVAAITLSANVQVISPMAFEGASKLASVTIDATNDNYFVDEFGVIYKYNPNGLLTLLAYPAGLTNTDYIAHEKTARVEAYAFAGNTSLVNLSLPERLRVVGASAFAGCSNLEKIALNCVDAPVLEMEYDPIWGVVNHNYENFKNTSKNGT
ncbi:MAG: leucine-rich repeat domain-containing protein, partial [Clostridia bacterium]|nr:leucine-rich repeat domain-containing protein [Clostridia bacterium]